MVGLLESTKGLGIGGRGDRFVAIAVGGVVDIIGAGHNVAAAAVAGVET